MHVIPSLPPSPSISNRLHNVLAFTSYEAARAGGGIGKGSESTFNHERVRLTLLKYLF